MRQIWRDLETGEEIKFGVVMRKTWRDLEIGEEMKIGDRCAGGDGKWFLMPPELIELRRFVDEHSRIIQREVR